MSRLRSGVVIVLFSVVGGAMIAAADLSRSYIPLFVGWLVFAAIPWVLTRIEAPSAAEGDPDRTALDRMETEAPE